MATSYRKFMEKIIREAGKVVAKKYGKVGVKYTKTNKADVVTEADLISNEIIARAIKKNFPSHGILSEEQGSYHEKSEHIWIVDPLDGTRNFVTRTPLFGVVIGLARRGVMQAAAILDPIHNELFYAEKGKGAFRNGKRIRASRYKELLLSFGCINAKWDAKRAIFMKKLIKMSEKKTFWATTFGSVAISSAYVADGRRDWYVSHGSSVWDYAAPSLILEEAGCTVTNFKGKRWTLKDKEFLVSNGYIHKELLRILA